jgi:hypothetical protein
MTMMKDLLFVAVATTVPVLFLTFVAYKFLVELRANREQRKNELIQASLELRWQQAKLGKKINDEFQDNPNAGVALLLLDYADTEPYRFKSRMDEDIQVTKHEVLQVLSDLTSAEQTKRKPPRVLKTANDFSSTENMHRESKLTRAVGQCFDSMLYYFAQFEHYLEIGLLQFEDLEFPSRYYIDRIAKDDEYKKQLKNYVEAFRLNEAERFMARFSSWNAPTA